MYTIPIHKMITLSFESSSPPADSITSISSVFKGGAPKCWVVWVAGNCGWLDGLDRPGVGIGLVADIWAPADRMDSRSRSNTCNWCQQHLLRQSKQRTRTTTECCLGSSRRDGHVPTIIIPAHQLNWQYTISLMVRDVFLKRLSRRLRTVSQRCQAPLHLNCSTTNKIVCISMALVCHHNRITRNFATRTCFTRWV